VTTVQRQCNSSVKPVKQQVWAKKKRAARNISALFSVFSTKPHCTTLYYTVLCCTTLHYTTTLHCTTLHYTALHCTTLYHTTLHCTALRYTVQYFTSTSAAAGPLLGARWRPDVDAADSYGQPGVEHVHWFHRGTRFTPPGTSCAGVARLTQYAIITH
jgi:hypothetical protein